MTADENELENDTVSLLGKPVVHFLHPDISNFILKRQEELNSTGQTPSSTETLTMRLEETWGRTSPDVRMYNTPPRATLLDTVEWETDP